MAAEGTMSPSVNSEPPALMKDLPCNRSLSPDAPAFTPKPHHVNLMNALDYSTQTLHCDLASLTVKEMYMYAAAHFGFSLDGFTMMFGGNTIPNQEGVKAIDVGVSNNMVVMAQPKIIPAGGPAETPCPPAAMSPLGLSGSPAGSTSPSLSEQLHNFNMAIAANQAAQMQLAAMAGIQVNPRSPSLMNPSPTPVSPPVMPMLQPPMMKASEAVSPHPGTRPTGSIDLSSVAGEFYTYALTNEGSRALVAALEELANPRETIEQVLQEIQPKFQSMTSHQFGCKVLKALLCKATPEQVGKMLRMCCEDIGGMLEANSSCDLFGEVIKACTANDDVSDAVAQMAAAVIPMCCSVGGRGVVQAAVMHFSASAIESFYDALGRNLLTIATDRCGCITVQRCLDNAANVKLKTQLQMQILEATTFLISDPFGNYVVQHAIKGEPYYSQMVTKKIQSNLADFAMNKFSSNVIERCLLIGPDDVRECIIDEVCRPEILNLLMQDKYGNFVVQSSIEYSPNSLLDKLRDCVLPLVSLSPYGYRIETKLQRRLKRTGGFRHPKKEHRVSHSMMQPQPLLSQMPTMPNQFPQVFSMEALVKQLAATSPPHSLPSMAQAP